MLNSLIDEVKKYLRINHDSVDGEIEDLINACINDLKLSGIASSKLPSFSQTEEPVENDTSTIDSLIKRAIVLYCKLNFGYDNPDYDKILIAYDLLKQHLSLSLDYNQESAV